MNIGTVTRLLRKSGQTCSIVAFSDTTLDRYDNPVAVEGSEQAGVPCLFVTPQSSRRGEFIDAGSVGLSDQHLLYILGTREVDEGDTIETVLQANNGGATVGAGPFEVTRIDRANVPLLLVLQLAEVR